MAQKRQTPRVGKRPRTLVVDIGGSGIKVMVLDPAGRPVTERQRVGTPRPATPAAVLNAIAGLAGKSGGFDRVSVGFPGIVRDGVTFTAPNLHPKWAGYPLAAAFAKRLRKPVRACNDADVQGFGAVRGRGVEMMITLGTGCGSALFVDGRLVPNIEIGQYRFGRRKTYEETLGKAGLRSRGKKKWNRKLADAIEQLRLVFNYDQLYIGGGNARKIAIDLPPNVTIVPNTAGLWGGIALWRDAPRARGGATAAGRRKR